MKRPTTLSDPNLEVQVIGALLRYGQNRGKADLVFATDSALGGPEAFDDHGDALRRATYEAIVSVANTGKPPTAATVGAELRQRGLGDAIVRQAMESNVLQGRDAYQMALDQLVEFTKRRRTYTALVDASDSIRQGEDADTTAARTAGQLLDITSGRQSDGGSFGRLAAEWEADRKRVTTDPETMWSIRFGIADIDHALGSAIRGGQLVIIGGHTGAGKSVACIDLLRANGIRGDHKPVMFSVEMSAADGFDRLLSAESGVSYTAIRDRAVPGVDIPAVEETLSLLRSKRPDDGWIIGVSWPHIRDVEAMIRKQVATEGTRLVIVDYLQRLMTDRGHSREREVSEMARRMKSLATELEIVIVCAAQLNDEIVGKRGEERRPRPDQVRESKDVHKDSDLFICIDRPTVRGDKVFHDGALCEDVQFVPPDGKRSLEFARLDFGKFRRGKAQAFTVLWRGDVQRFEQVPAGVNPPKGVWGDDDKDEGDGDDW